MLSPVALFPSLADRSQLEYAGGNGNIDRYKTSIVRLMPTYGLDLFFNLIRMGTTHDHLIKSYFVAQPGSMLLSFDGSKFICPSPITVVNNKL